MDCANCGTTAPAGATFCNECGLRLPPTAAKPDGQVPVGGGSGGMSRGMMAIIVGVVAIVAVVGVVLVMAGGGDDDDDDDDPIAADADERPDEDEDETPGSDDDDEDGDTSVVAGNGDATVWAAGICRAATDADLAVEMVDDEAPDTEDLEELKDFLVGTFEGLAAATGNWEAAITVLEPPDVPGAAEFQDLYATTIGQMAQVMTETAADAEGLDTSDPDRFLADLDETEARFDLASLAIDAGLERLDGAQTTPELDALFESVADCGDVELVAAEPEVVPIVETAEDADADGILVDVDACPDEPENVNGIYDTDGCPDTIENLIADARFLLDEFWAETFAVDGIEYFTVNEFVPYTVPIDTNGCGEATLDNAFYCPASHSVFFDVALMEQQLNSAGDFAPVFIVAHEWGHVVQGLLGIEEFPSIVIELQADCMAGVFTAHVDGLGLLDEGDVEEAAASLFVFGDRDVPVFDPSAHGTAGQRVDAFDRGLRGGLEACSVALIEASVQ